MSNYRAVITGGAGFIGSHLCEALDSAGHSVTILDNLSSGTRDNLKRVLQSSESISLVKGDCKRPKDVSKVLRDAEVVYHFAGNTEVRLRSGSTTACFQDNIYATHVLLEAMRKTNVETIAFASSSTVYGEAKIIPTPENYCPLQPISIYGASKLASEALIASYCRTYNKKAAILRLSNIIGPKNRHGVIRDFVTRLVANPRELRILGDGHQNKSYLYVEDCVSAIMKTCETARENFEVFNVGSDDQIEVSDIAKVIAEEMQLRDVQFKFTRVMEGGGWVGDVRNMLLETTALKSLGWKPRYNSKEAVKMTTRAMLRDPKSSEIGVNTTRSLKVNEPLSF